MVYMLMSEMCCGGEAVGYVWLVRGTSATRVIPWPRLTMPGHAAVALEKCQEHVCMSFEWCGTSFLEALQLHVSKCRFCVCMCFKCV